MNRFYSIFLLLTLFIPLRAAAYDIHEESIKYRVMYKWGLINKQAGSVTIDTRAGKNGRFTSELTGRSASWADHIYSVRDTLRGVIDASTYEPVIYEKIAREGGDYKYDRITFRRNGKNVTGECHRIQRKKNDKQNTEIHTTLEATGMTVDILSAFYYMRHLDYSKMQPDESVRATIFSGRRKEILRITYHGIEQLRLGRNQEAETYYITFTFTGDEGRKSSDDMFAWISTDQRRVPLKMKGNLPIGSVQCFLED